MAQEAATAPAPTPDPQPAPPCRNPHFKHIMAKFDANKDGQLDEQEKAAMKAAFEARKAEFEKKMLEKFDANKDGQLDDQEKSAMKEEFAKHRGPRRHGHGPAMHGPRHHGCPCCTPPPPPCCGEPELKDDCPPPAPAPTQE